MDGLKAAVPISRGARMRIGVGAMQRSKFRIASHQVMNEERTIAIYLSESLVAELRPDTKHGMRDVVRLRYHGDCI